MQKECQKTYAGRGAHWIIFIPFELVVGWVKVGSLHPAFTRFPFCKFSNAFRLWKPSSGWFWPSLQSTLLGLKTAAPWQTNNFRNLGLVHSQMLSICPFLFFAKHSKHAWCFRVSGIFGDQSQNSNLARASQNTQRTFLSPISYLLTACNL